MNLVLQKMTFVALAVAGAGVHGQELRGPAMALNADDAEAGLHPPGSTPAQRSCIDICHDVELMKQRKKISCENKCLELDDEDAEYIAGFIKYEDIELIADFFSDEESGDIVEVKSGNKNRTYLGKSKKKCKGKSKKKCNDRVGPCSADAIFRDQPRKERGKLERAARNGNLGRDYRDVWQSTQQTRRFCKRKVGADQCRHFGYCMEGEDEFDEAEY